MQRVIIHTIQTFRHCVGACASLPADNFEAHPGLWMFLAGAGAVATAIVSAVGLWFIFGQLKASRSALTSAAIGSQAAADAAKTAYASTRPWLRFEVTGAYLTFNPDNLEEVGCQINYDLKNIGSTPAVDVEIAFRPLAFAGGAQFNLDEELLQLRANGGHSPIVLFPDDKSPYRSISTNFPYPRLSNEDFVSFRIIAAVLYRAALDGESYWTPTVLNVQHKVLPADKANRFFRGMGHIECLAFRDGKLSPAPT